MHSRNEKENDASPIHFHHKLDKDKMMSNNKNKQTADNNQTISHCILIVATSVDDECYVINYDSLSTISLNREPLAENEQIKLLPGDLLSINNYQFQVSRIRQHHSTSSRRESEEQVTVISRTKEEKYDKNPIPDNIWDSLSEAFPIPFSASSISVSATEKNQDIQPSSELPTDNPGGNLAGNINVQQRTNDPMSLFNTNTSFEYESLLEDTTPSILLAENNPSPQELSAFLYTLNNDAFEGKIIPPSPMRPEKKTSSAQCDRCNKSLPTIINRILHSLNPTKLAGETHNNHNILKWLLPYYRKAVLWDHFVKTYQEVIADTNTSHPTI